MAETAQNTKKQPKQEVDGKLEWLREHGFIRSLEKHNGKGQLVATEEVVIYKGLLALAHEDGLKRLVTELVDFPADINKYTAIFEAEAETNKGTFRCHGDANPENVDEQIAPHYIRVAETRAKARVLRDALNIGLVCAEEFGLEVGANGVLSVRATNGKLKVLPKGKQAEDQPKASPADTSSPEPEKPKTSSASKNGNGPKASAKPKAGAETKPSSAKPEPKPSGATATNGDLMSDRQRNFLFRLATDLGHEDEDTHEFLKERLGVRSLKQVTKKAAGKLIEELLKEVEESPQARERLPF